MADNTTLPGTGDVIAADDVGGVKYQRMKLVSAATDSTEPIGVDDYPLFVKDESLFLLRRMVKLLEQQAAADPQQRQRVTIDAVTSGTGGPMTVAQATAGNLNCTIAAIPTGANTIGNVTVSTLAGYDQRQFIDIARNAYANGIRSKLTFS